MKFVIASIAAVALAGAAQADDHKQPAGDPGKKDARGITVHSMEGTAPSGANKTWTAADGTVYQVNPNQSAVFTPRQGEADLPPCTEERTDRCVQTYER
ncbi:hypothetical protein [Sphingomicrobium sediminis]|uniref:Secreted protein n=1 Tax=Sphingomicrobium sediminis TaxID=2950949 RepID=A0A9X2EKK8_9SPHN|nr:hypothetical protein [Sphingomicrobium sediminis]MCM8557102.1 hypothetical protein [Sphingomicrobium sediminis]